METSLNIISAFFVSSGFIIAFLLYLDVRRKKQPMKIMNAVWVLTGLWAHFFAAVAYLKFGRTKKKETMQMDMPMEDMKDMQMDMGPERSKWESIALSTLHCGAGCTLADVLGEGLASLAQMSILSGWILDFVLALMIGIYFQYSAIRQMGNIRPRKALGKAFKADFLSLTSWQVGMYGWMAIVYFVFFKDTLINKDSWVFWFMMQIAMLFGFVFAYPMNALLIKWGVKKGM